MRLCTAAATEIASPGVSIALIADSELHTVAATTTGTPGDQLQAALGEGPSLSSFEERWPVLVADLDDDRRWPAFARAASDAGLRAVFAFPLRRGAIRLGAFTLYRTVAGSLDDGEHDDATLYAELATDLLVSMQAGSDGDGLSRSLADGDPDAWIVHQATGMVAAQAQVPIVDALALLRAHAYTAERSLNDVAADVVGRRLRLDGDVTR